VRETARGDETLDLGCSRALGALLAVGELLARKNAAHDVLAHVVLLREVGELADARRTLRAEAARQHGVSETGQLGGALLDDDELHDGHVGAENAATNRLTTTLAGDEKEKEFVSTQGVERERGKGGGDSRMLDVLRGTSVVTQNDARGSTCGPS
jgi:hypothetical protein